MKQRDFEFEEDFVLTYECEDCKHFEDWGHDEEPEECSECGSSDLISIIQVMKILSVICVEGILICGKMDIDIWEIIKSILKKRNQVWFVKIVMRN